MMWRSFVKHAQIVGKYIRNAENAFLIVGMCMLMILMLIGTADVAGRYLLNNPIQGTTEMGKLLLAMIVITGWAYTQRTKGHVAVEFVVRRFPPRVRTTVNFITLLIALGLFVLIAWQAVVVGLQNLEQHRIVSVIHLPTAVMHFVVSLGAAIMSLELIIELLDLTTAARRKG